MSNSSRHDAHEQLPFVVDTHFSRKEADAVFDLRPARPRGRTPLRLLTLLLALFSLFAFLSSFRYLSKDRVTSSSAQDVSKAADKAEASPTPIPLSRPSTTTSHTESNTHASPAPLRLEDYETLRDPETPFCNNLYGMGVLEAFSTHRREFCPESHTNAGHRDGSFECFRGSHSDDNGGDNFCVLRNVLFEPQADKAFVPSCRPKEFDEEEVKKNPKLPQNLKDFMKYMFDTGPKIVFDENFPAFDQLSDEQTAKAADVCANSPDVGVTTILLKREDHKPDHPWHSLMDVASLHVTLDSLRLTQEKDGSGRPVWSENDIGKTQILLLDKWQEGPLFDGVKMLAKMPVLRLSDLRKDGAPPRCLGKVVVPLPGAAAPLWKGNWEPRSCPSSRLVDMFSHRIMKEYGVTPRVYSEKDRNKVIKIVFIDRKNRRSLKNKVEMLAKLQARYKRLIQIETIDFWTLTFAEQIRLASQTDILAGVHGSMLSNILYMDRGTAAVEFQSHGFFHYGFRNLAKYRGMNYFKVHTPKSDADVHWQDTDEIIVPEEDFMTVMEAAIRATFQRSAFSEDANGH